MTRHWLGNCQTTTYPAEDEMKTLLKIATIIAIIGLAGCAAPPWVAGVITDEFSDNSICRVAARHGAKEEFQERLLLGVVGTANTHEFIAEMRSDGPRIGVWARYGFFPGDVQIRVDNNPFVVITAQDTPIDTGAPQIQVPAIKLPNVTEEQQKAYEESLQNITKTTTRNLAAIGSPYRVATGKKAKTLIEQIRVGKQFKFRVLGINKAASTTARIEINEQFKSALRKCKIL